MPYSRRFRLGTSRFMTRANIDGEFVIITQSERMDNTRIDNRSSIILFIEDFSNLVIALGKDQNKSKGV